MDIENREHVKPVRRRYGAILVVVLTLLIAAFVVRRQEARTDEPPAPAATVKPPSDMVEATQEQLKQIRVEPVREQMLGMDLEATGKVGFNEDRLSPVFAPYSGRALEVLASKGDVVAAGQPLVVIESADLVATVRELAEARSDADKAKIALDAADKAAERARTLHSLEALATKELQAAEAEAARAREEYKRATAAVAVVRNRMSLFGKNADDVRHLEDGVNDQIDRRIEVRAPIAGTIVDRKVGPGQYIKPDMTDPLYLIGDLSRVWVTADIYETHLDQIRIGAPATITVAAYPQKQFPARISAINPTVDPATRTIHVRCSVANPDGLLKPEMFASIHIGNTVSRKTTMAPSAAIITQGSSSFVLREESEGHFRRRTVKAGREIDGYTVIEEGLAGTDRVVASGALLLSNGLGGK